MLIHGGGDVGWSWHLVQEELWQRGHDVVAPDLPCQDDATDLLGYAATVVDAIGDRRNLIVVGDSYGGFTAPLVADRAGPPRQRSHRTRRPVRRLLPRRAVRPRRVSTQQGTLRIGDSVRRPVAAGSLAAVATKFVLCTEDRFLPAEFTRRVVAERLGIVPDEIAAGHCVALSRPRELADVLDSYAPARSR